MSNLKYNFYPFISDKKVWEKDNFCIVKASLPLPTEDEMKTVHEFTDAVLQSIFSSMSLKLDNEDARFNRLKESMAYMSHGWYCGYIAIPIPEDTNLLKIMLSPEFSQSLDAHGGITYMEKESTHIVYGFDCNHHNDQNDSSVRSIEVVMDMVTVLEKSLTEQLSLYTSWVKEVK